MNRKGVVGEGRGGREERMEERRKELRREGGRGKKKEGVGRK